MQTRPSPEVISAVVDRLRERYADRLSTTTAIREAHGRGEGGHALQPPDAVFTPRDNAEVADALSLCNFHRVPVIPFGVGTSLEGQVQAPLGGLSLDLSAMNKILEVNAADLDARVEAGVTREQLNVHLRDSGLFFPLDPGANATLGGMASTRASGTNAVRYGTMREITLGLTIVTPDGAVIRTGGRARKSSSGYDLTRLYVGSEGTLGVITELQLRLFGVPETIVAAVCQFGDLQGAVETVSVVLQMGVPIARIELLDTLQMAASIAYSKLIGLSAQPTLFFEFHGSPGAVEEQVTLTQRITRVLGGGEFRQASAPKDRADLWSARHNAYWAGRALRPGCDSFATDACVPISELPACIAEARAAADESGLMSPVTGHVGDGNFHMNVLFDPKSLEERSRADALASTIAKIALAHHGTVSGEHGVGQHKINLMQAEHGDALSVMRALKAALDPHSIMNPGKMIPQVQ